MVTTVELSWLYDFLFKNQEATNGSQYSDSSTTIDLATFGLPCHCIHSKNYHLPSLKPTQPLKMDGWKTILSYWVSAYFTGANLLLVFGSVPPTYSHGIPHKDITTYHNQHLFEGIQAVFSTRSVVAIWTLLTQASGFVKRNDSQQKFAEFHQRVSCL